jgi:hypothetical protein
VFNIVLSFVLFITAFFSIIEFGKYVVSDEVVIGAEAIVFVITIIVLMVLVSFFNVTSALTVYQATRSDLSLRILYFNLLFPVVLFSFFIATSGGWFINSMIFGFPLFLMGAMMLPYAAYRLHWEALQIALKGPVRLRCYDCGFIFDFFLANRVVRCPKCGLLNRNPIWKDTEEGSLRDMAFRSDGKDQAPRQSEIRYGTILLPTSPINDEVVLLDHPVSYSGEMVFTFIGGLAIFFPAIIVLSGGSALLIIGWEYWDEDFLLGLFALPAGVLGLFSTYYFLANLKRALRTLGPILMISFGVVVSYYFPLGAFFTIIPSGLALACDAVDRSMKVPV